MQSLETKSSRPRPKSFETFETETQKTGFETRLEIPIYKRLHFLKAQDIYKSELAKLMHKFHDGLFPSIYNGLFQR